MGELLVDSWMGVVPRDQAVIRGEELTALPPMSGKKEGLGIEVTISHAHVMQPP